jgi:hypothetical protein
VAKYSGTQTGTPTARIELWQNGVLVRAGANENVTAASPGQVLSFVWDASELTSDPTGAQVECKIVGTQSGGSTGVRNSVNLGAVEWNAQLAAWGDDFAAVAGPLDSAKWGDIVAALDGGSVLGTWTAVIDATTPRLKIDRSGGTGGAQGHVTGLDSVAAGLGRTVKVGGFTFPTGTYETRLRLAGGTYVYDFCPTVDPEVFWDDEYSEWLIGPRITVNKRNASTGEIVTTTQLEPKVTGTWGTTADIEVRFVAGGNVEARGNAGQLMGSMAIGDLPSFAVGLGMTVGSNGSIFADYVATWVA